MTNQIVRPRIFIGSSSEGRRVADELTSTLSEDFDVTPWSQGVFGLSEGTLESLIKATDDYDFAVFVLTADDVVTKRDVTNSAPRDNVLFEIGLFMGKLGRSRTFMVYSEEDQIDLHLPSDLLGITKATYRRPRAGPLQPALVPAMVKIRNGIESVIQRQFERTDEIASLQELNRICTRETRRLNAIVGFFLTDDESKLLLDLSTGAAVPYNYSGDKIEGFRNSVRKLRDKLDLLKRHNEGSLTTMPGRGDLRDLVELSDLGWAYVRLAQL